MKNLRITSLLSACALALVASTTAVAGYISAYSYNTEYQSDSASLSEYTVGFYYIRAYYGYAGVASDDSSQTVERVHGTGSGDRIEITGYISGSSYFSVYAQGFYDVYDPTIPGSPNSGGPYSDCYAGISW